MSCLCRASRLTTASNRRRSRGAGSIPFPHCAAARLVPIVMRIFKYLICLCFAVLPVDRTEAGVSDLRYFFFTYETANTKVAMTYSLERAVGREAAPDNSVAAEKTILITLIKAMELGVDTELVRRVFVKHRCIMTARNNQDYRHVAELVDRLDFGTDCRVEANAGLMYVIPSDGAFIHSGPSIEHERMIKIPGDMLVRSVEKTDGWHIVEYSGITGYVEFNLLAPYL